MHTTILINPDLRPDTTRLAKRYMVADDMLDSLRGRKAVLVKPVQVLQEGHVPHSGYMQYLELCWKHHLVAVLSPDIFRHILQCQFAELVCSHSEAFRGWFTTRKEGKETILLDTADPVTYPLAALEDVLSRKLQIPAEFWTHRFSTTTTMSHRASVASMARAASPFYNYEMKLCGLPALRIDGDEADWKTLWQLIEQMRMLFEARVQLEPELDNAVRVWLANSSHRAADLYRCVRPWDEKTNEAQVACEFAESMFKMTECGSGSDLEVAGGWIEELYLKRPSFKKGHNYASSISFMDYTEISCDRDFRMYSGLLGSNVMVHASGLHFLDPVFDEFVVEFPKHA